MWFILENGFIAAFSIIYFILLISYIFSKRFRSFLKQGVRFYTDRISPSDFRGAIWADFLFSIFILGSTLLAGSIFAAIVDSLPLPFYITDPWLVLAIIFLLPTALTLVFVILLAISAKRRLQDMNIRGYLAYFLYAILPVIAVLDSNKILIEQSWKVFMKAINAFSPTIIALAFTIILTIILALRKGTSGANYYGDPVE